MEKTTEKTTSELTEEFSSILEFYDERIKDKLRRGVYHLVIDFVEFSKLSIDLANLLLDNPEELMEIGTNALKGRHELKNKFYLRFKNVPRDTTLRIRDIRSHHLNKLIAIEGFIQSKSDVKPQIISAKFECPNCGHTMNILQVGTHFKEPTKCVCKRQGKFNLLSKELIDGFSMILEESPEIIKYGSETKKMHLLVKADLSNSQIEEMLFQGQKVKITGVLKERYVEVKGQKKLEMDYYVEANYIDFLEVSFADIKISPEEEKKIIEFSQRKDILQYFAENFFESIYGYSDVKEAIILQAFGGVGDLNPISRKPKRGEIHILLLGDPGTGKSTFLKIACSFLPKFRYSTGSGATGRGLTACVIKDEFLGGYTVSAGVLPLAHNGVALLDELDKADDLVLKDLHEPLEQGTCTVSRGSIQKTLLSKTAILAAANPKFGRFNNIDDIYRQIKFQPTFINRFDLIFLFRDEINEERDKKMAMKILGEQEENDVDYGFLKKYIAYAKRIKPMIPDNLNKIISDKYSEIRKRGGTDTIPISGRQVGAIKRLAEAHSRLKLRTIPLIEDINFAINLVEKNLYDIAYDKETGKLDLDIIQTGTSAKKRNIMEDIQNAFIELENTYYKNPIPFEEVIKKLETRHTESEIEEMIEKMRRSGILMEPRRGFLQRV